jgi:hypothetical protein
MRAFLLTLGTRGDVQPFVALRVGLAHSGHDVTVCTTANFAPLVERQGLRCAPLDPEIVEFTQGEAGRRAIENFGGGPLGKAKWIVEASRRFKPSFRRLFAEQWEAARRVQRHTTRAESTCAATVGSGAGRSTRYRSITRAHPARSPSARARRASSSRAVAR